MNDEFQWWLLLLGACLGAGILWLVTGQLARREEDVDAAELAVEAEWISDTLARDGNEIPPTMVREVLELHRGYLLKAPPLPIPRPAGRAEATAEEETQDVDGGTVAPPTTTAARADEAHDESLAASIRERFYRPDETAASTGPGGR